MNNNIQNLFLEELENFEGILIATTNFAKDFDKAFDRRFNYKLNFKLPSKEEREKIWELNLPNIMENRKEFSLELSKYELSGSQIKNIILKVCEIKLSKNIRNFEIIDFENEIKMEKIENKMGFC